MDVPSNPKEAGPPQRAVKSAGILIWGPPGVQDLHVAKVLKLSGIPWSFIDAEKATARGEAAPEGTALVLSAENIQRGGRRVIDYLSGCPAVFVFGLTPEGSILENATLLSQGLVIPVRKTQGGRRPLQVSADHPAICGRFSGLEIPPSAIDDSVSVLKISGVGCETLVSQGGEAVFVRLRIRSQEFFLLTSSTIADLDVQLSGNFHVRDFFLALFPILMFLRRVFQDSSWQASAPQASLIIDDPPLWPRYGFLDFARHLKAMDEIGFSTSLAFIPWNHKRSRPETVAMIRSRHDKWGLCFHGCDHTGAEFGSDNVEWLATLTALAIQRMAAHEQNHGVVCQRIMVFPQGVFSASALRVLKSFNFLAAVNTEIVARQPNGGCTTVPLSQLLQPAITHYSDFAVFTRRKLTDDLCDFAADLFLAKPCLIVCHHGDFREGGSELLKRLAAIRRLAPEATWASLGKALQRSYCWRQDPDGSRLVHMFASELALFNDGATQQTFRVRQRHQDHAEVQEVLVNGKPAIFGWDGDFVTTVLQLAPRQEAAVRMVFANRLPSARKNLDLPYRLRASMRRYMCDFRDNYLEVGRHALLTLTQPR